MRLIISRLQLLRKATNTAGASGSSLRLGDSALPLPGRLQQAAIATSTAQSLRAVVSALASQLEQPDRPTEAWVRAINKSLAEANGQRAVAMALTCVRDAYLEMTQPLPEIAHTSFSRASPCDSHDEFSLLCDGSVVLLNEKKASRRQRAQGRIEASTLAWDISMRMWAKALAICGQAESHSQGRLLVDKVTKTFMSLRPALRCRLWQKPALDKSGVCEVLEELRELQKKVLDTTLDNDLTRLRMAVAVAVVTRVVDKQFVRSFTDVMMPEPAPLLASMRKRLQQAKVTREEDMALFERELLGDNDDDEMLELLLHITYDNLVMTALCGEHEMHFTAKKLAWRIFNVAFVLQGGQPEEVDTLERFWRQCEGPKYDDEDYGDENGGGE